MKVYFLQHSRIVEPDVTSSISIGIYSSMKVVNMTINKYKGIEGFKDYPDDFVVEEYEVIGSNNKEILSDTIYFLQHEYSIKENGVIYDYVTDIGVFLNYEDAKKVMEELKRDPEYINKTDGLYSDNGGFNIDKCILDEDAWTEGFITYEY